ncbi:MAG TPA: acyltransferase [Kofleriaceae bacterium]|nr:acyltransferase [Kofleriaceae bacterium]
MTTLIPLSAVDHMWSANMAGPLQLVLEYSNELDVQRLTESLHETVREYVGLGGVLVQVDPSTLAIDTSGERSIVRTTSDGPEIPLAQCIDPVDPRVGEPVARVRIVRRGTKGTAIGYSMSHAVADGYGMFLFLSAWAARARGGVPLPPPICDRDRLTRPHARARGSFDEAALERAGFVLVSPELSLPTLQVEERVIAISELAAGDPRSSGASVSNVLAATLWKEYAEARTTPTITLACPVDLRRHRGELGPLYFGNAFLQVLLTVETARVRAAPVLEVADWVREAVSSAPARFDAALEELEAFRFSAGLATLARVWGYPPTHGFLVSNLSRVPLANLDFGGGAPVGFTAPPPPSGPRAEGCFVWPGTGDRLRLHIMRR